MHQSATAAPCSRTPRQSSWRACLRARHITTAETAAPASRWPAAAARRPGSRRWRCRCNWLRCHSDAAAAVVCVGWGDGDGDLCAVLLTEATDGRCIIVLFIPVSSPMSTPSPLPCVCPSCPLYTRGGARDARQGRGGGGGGGAFLHSLDFPVFGRRRDAASTRPYGRPVANPCVPSFVSDGRRGMQPGSRAEAASAGWVWRCVGGGGFAACEPRGAPFARVFCTDKVWLSGCAPHLILLCVCRGVVFGEEGLVCLNSGKEAGLNRSLEGKPPST
mmetsp:Transcript_3879/g.11035  ORF Transcript_3879/g.11035 Transcript_3879/m.11035 type:complete len:275 (+) Transcript_3879:2066-2890(+)